MSMTTKEFCDALRAQAVALANGEKPEITIKDFDLQLALGAESVKINASYIRTIMNRVPEVKAIGTVKVKRIKGHDEMPDCFVVTVSKETKRKVITNDDLPRLEQSWRNRFIKHLLKTTPRITDLEGDELKGAAIAIERFIALIEDYAKEGDE